jgi:hypothetical protein
MIQIQRPEQFTRAAERLHKEPQVIRRHESGLYAVTNDVLAPPSAGTVQMSPPSANRNERDGAE